MKMYISLLFSLLFSLCFANAAWANFDHSHKNLTEVLNSVVQLSKHASTVNYKKLKSNPKKLNAYLKSISSVKKSEFENFSKKQKMSFLINAYNAFTLKLIIDNYPLESIKDLGGFFSSPWKKEFISLLGDKVSLDHIEHERLRKNYNEPRIHFAVNCASIGCPRLLNKAYTSEDLDKQFENQAMVFLTDKTRNYIYWKEKEVYLSKIFSWFKKDFGENDQQVLSFVLPYMQIDKDKIKAAKEFDISNTNYDWNLNK